MNFVTLCCNEMYITVYIGMYLQFQLCYIAIPLYQSNIIPFIISTVVT